MNTNSVIVTGGTSGLGFECVRALLHSDPAWHVVLPVRDQGRGAAAVDELGAQQRCTVLPMDLASLASVRGFTDEFSAADLPPLRAIVCNAGVQVVAGTQRTEDDIEMTFGVNHLGHFALVQGLLGQLVPPARIVVVSSGTHDPDKRTGMPDPCYTSAASLADPDASLTHGRQRYTTSKLCNVLFAYELDRRLGDGVTVNAFDPGLMPGSGLARDYPPLQRFAWRYLLPALRVLPGVRSTRASGRYLSALVTDARYDGVSGQYFAGRRPIKSSAESYDRAKARDLWETSQALLAHAAN
ncbi:SDR family NAD(P)-dependent oxidoreductase [Mycobacterium sp. NPDC048908]|uniref:SDR family NAD(P)-dependent oxidoreductase n=1 Tax=Mycobacterium sp. NPDC048908 TaxID=3364292 RepID=UPI0037217FB4